MGERMWRRTVTELSSYPTELDVHVTLTDQRRVRIRALHSREERPIRVLHARLSPRTRYLRFLSPIPTLPDALVRRLACVDYRRRLAVVAEDEGAGCAGVVALASFSAVDETTAEVAVVVQDDWQRQGVGTARLHAARCGGEAWFRPLRRHHRGGQLDHPTAAQSFWPGRRQPHEPRCI
jgi:GNAT superfamily N-acetyltransferase